MLLIILAPRAAQAGTAQKQRLVYEVYAGGIHAVQAKLSIDYTAEDRYSLVLFAHTRGFLGALAPWEGTFESHGWMLEGGTFQTELHKSTTVWGGETEIKEYLYGRDGSFKSLKVTDEHQSAAKKEVEDALTHGTIDALTAALLVMENIASGEKCEGSSEVFDGKRRFEQMFRHQRTDTLVPSKYNIYGGKAAECTVEVKPVAGEWHSQPRGWLSIQEQGRARGTMPTVWMARIGDEGPAVPVKIRVKTAYGTLFMHLAEYRSGDAVMVAEKREK